MLLQKKQISGLEQALSDLLQNVGAINLGQPTLVGTVLTLPFSDKDGAVTNRTVDLQSLGVDINVASAVIDPNSYKLTITETDGTNHEVSLSQVFANYIAQYVTPAVEAAQTTATNAGTAAAAAQTTANDATSAAQTAQTTATNAGTAAASALQGLDTKVNKTDVSQFLSVTESNRDVNPDKVAGLDSLNELRKIVNLMVAKLMTASPTVLKIQTVNATSGDGDVVGSIQQDVYNEAYFHVGGQYNFNLAIVNGAVYPIGLPGATTPGIWVKSTQTQGGKLKWNPSIAGFNIANGDQVFIVGISYEESMGNFSEHTVYIDDSQW